MSNKDILVVGSGNAGLTRYVAALVGRMEFDVILLGDCSMGLPNINEIIELRPPKYHDIGLDKLGYTPDREYGWYRKFEKNGKNRNLKKAR